MSRYRVTKTLTHTSVIEADKPFDAICQYCDDWTNDVDCMDDSVEAERIPEPNEVGQINHLKFLADMEAEGNPVKKIWYELNLMADRCGFIMMDQAEAEEEKYGITIEDFDNFYMDSVRTRIQEALQTIEESAPELFKVVK